MRREMVWAVKELFRGWICSECAWKFNPSGPPAGNTIAEMKEHYERQRDREFLSHVCAEHPRVQKLNSSSAQQPSKAKARAADAGERR